MTSLWRHIYSCYSVKKYSIHLWSSTFLYFWHNIFWKLISDFEHDQDHINWLNYHHHDWLNNCNNTLCTKFSRHYFQSFQKILNPCLAFFLNFGPFYLIWNIFKLDTGGIYRIGIFSRINQTGFLHFISFCDLSLMFVFSPNPVLRPWPPIESDKF